MPTALVAVDELLLAERDGLPQGHAHDALGHPDRRERPAAPARRAAHVLQYMLKVQLQCRCPNWQS